VLTAARDDKPHRERDAAWSPDGREIAFLSDAAQEGQLQIYVAPAAGGAARVLTRAHGQLEHPRWSPDGKRIAVLYVAGSAQEQGALVAYKPDAGVVEEKVEEQRIAIVDAAGGELREVSPADLYVYDYDWSPDGRRFAAEAVHGSGTNNYWTAELYVVDAASGEAALALEAAAADRAAAMVAGRGTGRGHPRPHERRRLDGRGRDSWCPRREGDRATSPRASRDRRAGSRGGRAATSSSPATRTGRR
jgi:dipeptidyl aminopeptidase/acylaminoacyl peptidase